MLFRKFGIVFLALGLAASAQHKRPRKPAPHPAKPQPVVFDAGAINNPNQGEIKMGAKGSAVVRAQILLDRAREALAKC